jgi:ATP-binding protein involved in chromosome partitioning
MTNDDGGTTAVPDDELLHERVEAALRSVRDPDADLSVFEAGLVESIDVTDGAVVVEAAVGEFDDQHARGVVTAMLDALRDVPGVERAHVEPVTPSAEAGEGGVAAFDRVVAVASAKGGVGKSTVAAGLACALAGDGSVGLFDADLHGPNLPDLLGASGPVYSDDEGHPLPVSVAGANARLDVMSVGLMEEGAPLAWRGAMAHDALTELYTDTAWRADDTLVVDLPPGTGDVVLTTLQEISVDGVVVVTTPSPSAVADTARSVELFRDNGVPVLGAVVNMADFTCPSCGDTHALFADDDPLAGLDAPTLARLPFDRAFQTGPTPGDGPDAFVDLAGRVREAAATAWEVDAPDDAVDLRGLPPEARRDAVRERVGSLDPGDEFAVVSDRDPTPVGGFLADRLGVDRAALSLDVARRTPDDWLLTTTVPRPTDGGERATDADG